MIIYDLQCGDGHRFEGWFQDISAFETQKEQKLISCPVCAGVDVVLLPATVKVMGRDSKGERKEELSPQKALQLLQEYVEKHFDDVGDRFADVAIRIHEGEEEERNIKGITTSEEEDTLKEKGIKFFKIPACKFDS